MRTDATTLNRHYSDFYADDPAPLGVGWVPSRRRRASNSWSIVRSGRVVDIGCGEGSVIAALQGSLGAGFSGFEVAPAAIEVARRRPYDSPVEFVLFDGRSIPDQDKAYDVATLSHVLEHVTDPRSLLHEVAGVPSRVVIEVPLEVISAHFAFAGKTRGASTSSTAARSGTSSRAAA